MSKTYSSAVVILLSRSAVIVPSLMPSRSTLRSALETLKRRLRMRSLLTVWKRVASAEKTPGLEMWNGRRYGQVLLAPLLAAAILGRPDELLELARKRRRLLLA